MSTQIELIKKHGLSIRGHLGQHLLVDPNMQKKIVALAIEDGEKEVFEIGPGLGALTGALLEAGLKVTAVEKDEKFIAVLKEEFAEYGAKLKIISGDILKADMAKILRTKKTPWTVVSNLPYYITAPILFEILENRSLVRKAVLMMQKEVARRMNAAPGTKDYGRLSLGVRYAAEVTHAFDVPPGCFTPRPAVDSSVVVLRLHTQKDRLPEAQEAALFRLIKAAFGQRRKTLYHILSRAPEFSAKTPEVFEKLGFARTVRGEELFLKDYLAMAEFFTPAKKTRRTQETA